MESTTLHTTPLDNWRR